MPFVKSTPLLWGHLQSDNDPVRQAAEAYEPRVEALLAASWNALVREVPDRIPGPEALQALAVRLKQIVAPVSQGLLAARARGQNAMMAQIQPLRKDFSVSFQFERLSPAVQEQADLHAAQFVREVAEDTRTTLATVMRDAVARGLGPPETARTIRESIGLTVAQANAVQNYRRMLVEGDPTATTRALHDPRFGENVANLAPDQIDARVDAYRRRYVAYRANTIARYETLRASNSGAVAAIQTSVKSGLLPAGTVKIWLIAKDENTCERCRSIPLIQPSGVPVNDAFVWRHGKQEGEIQFAPLHPSCRCTNSYRVMS